MEIDFINARIKECLEAMKYLENMDFYSYSSSRVTNQRNVNKAYNIIFNIKKQLQYQKLILEREVEAVDLDDEELEATRRLNGADKLGSLRLYLNKLDVIQINLNGLPTLDSKSVQFYKEVSNKVDEETDRVNDLLLEEEMKHIPRID